MSSAIASTIAALVLLFGLAIAYGLAVTNVPLEALTLPR